MNDALEKIVEEAKGQQMGLKGKPTQRSKQAES